jgi:antitoxin component YwqK of YwqJK toxin-antitoxin module
MKTTIKIFFLLFLFGCNEDKEKTVSPASPQIIGQEINGTDTVLTIKYFYPSGKLKYISNVTTYGEKHGFETFYFENGIQKYQYYFIGKSVWTVGKGNTITGDSLFMGNLAFGIGEFRQYSDSGRLEIQGFYKDSQNDSIWSFYYPSGKLERKVGWKNGLQHGKFERYFENGKIDRDILWEKGYMVHSKDYFDSGRLFREINYKNGLEDGKAIEYYDVDNRARQIRNYKDGKENGYMYHYNPDGTLSEKAKLLNGQIIDTFFKYNSTGQIIETKIIKPKQKTRNSTTI